MPRTAEANLALRNATRDKVLDAAVRLFSRRGFHGTSVRAIAEEAGIAQGLMYSHFKSKDDVLAALMRANIFDVQGTFAEAESETTAEGFVLRLLQSAKRAVAGHIDAWRLNYTIRHQPDVLARVAGPVDDFTSGVIEHLRKALAARGVPNAKTEAFLLFALVDGICQQYVMLMDACPVDAVIRAAAARYAGFKRRKR
jgi:AcrR family transcriptional regulator